MKVDTRSLTFFHGTSAEFAREISDKGSDEQLLAEIGALELGERLANQVRTVAGIIEGAWLPSAPFPDADESDLMLVDNALLRRDQGFEYGGFFCSLNRDVATSYAHHGSEYLRALNAALRLLRKSASEMSEKRFSRLRNILFSPHEPALVEVSGISIDRLRATRESPSIDDTLALYEMCKGDFSFRAPLAVRIIGVTRSEVRGIVVLPRA